jgi:hypothetical protein
MMDEREVRPLFKIEFIDQSTNSVFREKIFNKPRDMSDFLKKFNLKEGVEFTFYDEHLNAIPAVFVCLVSFIKGKEMGFRMYFLCDQVKLAHKD